MTGIAFSLTTVTFCMYSIAVFCFVIFTLIRLCCKCVSDVHTGKFLTMGVPTIYTRCGAFDVNGF